MRKILFTTLIAFFVGFNSYAIGYTTVDKIDISEVWIEKNTTADNAILYMNVQNNNEEDIFILGASSPNAANIVEIHNDVKDEIIQARKLDKVLLPQNSLVQFKPEKIHIMLIDLKHELKSRDIIKVTLLTNAGTKVIKASVR